MKAREWGNPPSRGNKIQIAQSPPKTWLPTNLETDSGDFQSDVLSELTSTKRKDQSLNRPTKSAKKANDKTPKVRSWTPERVELLLKYLKEYKVTCDFNGKDFEQDLSAMYTEIRRCLS